MGLATLARRSYEMPYVTEEEARLRRICSPLTIRALAELTDVRERLAFFTIVGNIPDRYLDGASDDEVRLAIGRLDGGTGMVLHADVAAAWTGCGVVIHSYVGRPDRQTLVSRWCAVAVLVADARVKRVN